MSANNLVANFSSFVELSHPPSSHTTWRQQRIDAIAVFLQNPSVQSQPFAVRIQYLLYYCHYPEQEIEAALEQCRMERELCYFLEYLQHRTTLESPMEELNAAPSSSSAKTGREFPPSSTNGSDAGDPSSKAAAAAAATSANQNAAAAAAALGEFQYWRVGAMVYAFKGDCSYYLAPLEGFDLSRTEDVVMVRHQLPTGEYGPIQYQTAGLKGVVPDEFPPYELMRPGMTVLAEYPGAYRQHLKECVILAVSEKGTSSDGGYTVDLEWSHAAEVSKGVDHRSVRLLQHPKQMERELARRAQEQSAFQSKGDLIPSATTLATFPAHTEPVSPAETTEYLKNFMRFPELDRGVQPRGTINGSSFVSNFGQMYTAPDGRQFKSFPMAPESQLEDLRSGFGFSLTEFERHPLSPMHYVRNPIVDICRQCVSKDSMFVDPEFPPSFYSLTGAAGSSGGGSAGSTKATMPPAAGIVWRRCSELFSKPRLFSVGSKALDLTPGVYSPPWLVNTLHVFRLTAEAEESISPGDDGWQYGVYAARVLLDGSWTFVVVDDFVPCREDTQEPVCILSSTSGEIYAAICEKILAKLAGSYAALRYAPNSLASRAWEDLTSNACETMEHAYIANKDTFAENLHAIVSTNHHNGRLLAQVSSRSEQRLEEMGLHPGDWWYVDCVSEYNPASSHIMGSKKATQYFFHVCRPTHVGQPVPYMESFREKLFHQFPPQAVDNFPTRSIQEDGVSYWMSTADYTFMFQKSHIFWFFNNTQRAVIASSFLGRPMAGPKMKGLQAWLSNPQIFLSFVQPADVIIVVQLVDQRYGRRKQAQHRPLTASSFVAHLVRGLPVERPLTVESDYVASSQSIDLGNDEEAKRHPSVMIRTTLPGGNYILVPSLSDFTPSPYDEDFGKIIVKVFSFAAFYGKVLN